MTKRKAGSAAAKATGKGKRKKARVPPKASKLDVQDEKIQRLVDNMKVLWGKVNEVLKHGQFIHQKMFQLSKIAGFEMSRVRTELDDLRCATYKTVLFPEGAEGLFTDTDTENFTPPPSDEGMLSEEALIENLEKFSNSLPCLSDESAPL